jgi:hypothetical protein
MAPGLGRQLKSSSDIGTSPLLGSSSDKSQFARMYVLGIIGAKAQWPVEKLNRDVDGAFVAQL